MKHTPELLRVKATAIEFTDDSKLIGSFDVEFKADSISFPEMEAVAQIFAAAPALLDALKEISAMLKSPAHRVEYTPYQQCKFLDSMISHIDPIIAKAEGKPVETKKPTTIRDLIGEDFFG